MVRLLSKTHNRSGDTKKTDQEGVFCCHKVQEHSKIIISPKEKGGQSVLIAFEAMQSKFGDSATVGFESHY